MRRPSSFAHAPELFGRADVIDWAEAQPEDEPALRAAQLQHDVARVVRAWLNREHLRQAEALPMLGSSWTAAKLSRVLNGEVQAKAADILELMSLTHPRAVTGDTSMPSARVLLASLIHQLDTFGKNAS